MAETLKSEVVRLFRAADLPLPESDELVALLNKLKDDKAVTYVLRRCAVRADEFQRCISECVLICEDAIQLLARGAPDSAAEVLGVAVRRGKGG